jgi:hypothetical protein
MMRHTVSDRDVLPVEVLQNLMGWPAVARIWWPMWIQNRQEVVAQIQAAVDRAEAVLDISAAVAPIPVEPLAPPLPLTEPTIATPSSPLPILTAGPAPIVELPQPVPSAGSLTVEPSSTAASPPQDRNGSEADVWEFVPAHTSVVGSREILDRLHERTAAALVREQILDIIETEGPVEVGRLVRIVGRRYALNTVRAARAEEIAKLVPRDRLRKSKRFGDFAWPSRLDPDSWQGFRCSGETVHRTLDEVAPEEIKNAMETVLEIEGLEYVDQLRTTAERFGIGRLGANVRARLDGLHKQLERERKKAEEAAVARQEGERDLEVGSSA